MPAPITPASAQVPSDPDAPVVLDFSVHALQVALVSRRDVLKLPPKWAVPGVYVLLGALGSGGTTELYVGKAVKVRDRLNHHRTKPKLDWWRAVAITRDTTAGFNSAEIQRHKQRAARAGYRPRASRLLAALRRPSALRDRG